MEKKLLKEIYKINAMMGLKLHEQPESVMDRRLNIVHDEESLRRYNQQSQEPDPDTLRYGTRTINPMRYDSKPTSRLEKGEYEGFNNKPFKILAPKEGGEPTVWKISKDMKWSTLIPGMVKYGTVESDDGFLIENQPYIEKDNKILCLPDEAWLKQFEGLVYKFKSPKTGKEYAITMSLRDTSDIPYGPNGMHLTGIEAAQKCFGGDNGWVVLASNVANIDGKIQIDGGRTPYKDINSNEYWTDDVRAELFDTRSDDDIFWDEYGMKIEIGIGILVALVTAGIGSVFSLSTGIIIAMEIALEAGLLYPKMKNSWDRGNEIDSVITGLFCLLPIAFNFAPIKRFLSTGLNPNIAEATIQSLLKKIDNVGGFEVILKRSDYFTTLEGKQLLQSLTKAEREALEVGLAMSKNMSKAGPMELKIFAEEVEKFIKANGKNIDDFIRQKGMTWAEQIVDNLGQAFVKNMSIAYGGGILPVLTRGFLIVMPVYKLLWGVGEKIKENLTHIDEKNKEKAEAEAEKLTNYLTKEIVKDAYTFYTMQLMYMINQEKAAADLIKAGTVSYKDAQGNQRSEEDVKSEISKNVAGLLKNWDAELKSSVEKKDRIEYMLLKQRLDTRNRINEVFTKLGLTNVVTSNSTSLEKPWDFECDYGKRRVNGVINFEKMSDGTHKFVVSIDGNQIYPILSKPIDDIITRKNTTRTTRADKKENIKYCCISVTSNGYRDCPKDEYDVLPDNERREIAKEGDCKTVKLINHL